MESAPVAFLPRGSLVEVLQSKISPQLGLLSRRVLVRHIADTQSKSTEVVQGWASIQSWQGYVILSPLSSLCYTNTRWGPTRPIIRQCGHAAHFRCVEAHTLSLHQRHAGGMPFDGRFSANIEDGEFLCPLCKQLSNILIPEDKQDSDDAGALSQASSMSESKDGFEILKNNVFSSPADTTPIRNILLRKAPVSYSETPSKIHQATIRFGSNLSQAMELSSDDVSTQRRKEREYWHRALRQWDFQDDHLGSESQIGSILRLMRQQLISWAAVGHSAAAAEASGRGSRQEMFGEVTYTSKDPWSDYTSKERDSHPMLLELRRTMSASASFFDLVTYELGKQLGSNEEKSKGESVPLLGSLLSDILEGQHWMVKSSSTESDNEWRVVTSVIASMICHVSREDTVAPRLEARAVAAAMWTITGSTPASSSSSNVTMNLDSSPEVEVSEDGNIGVEGETEPSDDPAQNDSSNSQTRPVLPPKPLSIYRVERNLALQLKSNWGELDPFKVELESLHQKAFRPAVASAFLYVPLLAWDLNILAGAVFSSLLSNAKSNPCVTTDELLQSAKVLLVGRLVQVLSTPDGFLASSADSDEYDEFDDEEMFWDDEKKKRESTAIKELLSLCRNTLSAGPVAQDLDDSSLLQNVGNAIFPFGRTLILLLRASSSVIRQRNRRKSGGATLEELPADKAVTQMVVGPAAMSIDDGFQLLDVIGAPLPSTILKADSSQSPWISLVTRWLTALKGFEAYHGTRGQGLAFDEKMKAWTSKAHDLMLPDRSSPRGAPSLQNLQVQPSPGAVEVAQLPPQGGDVHDNDGDSDADFEEESEESSGMSNEDEGMDVDDDALEEDSDEELEHVDMDVDFDEEYSDLEEDPVDDFGAQGAAVLPAELEFDVDDASDVNAALSEPDGSKISGPDDRMFSYVSRSAILPYQPSILGLSQVGPGPRGARGELFEYKVANCIMKDLSHLGSIHLPGETHCIFCIRCMINRTDACVPCPPRSTFELLGEAPQIICRVV